MSAQHEYAALFQRGRIRRGAPQPQHRVLSHSQFDVFLRDQLGDEASEDSEAHEGVAFDSVPPHVFRVVSDEDYRQSMERGYMRSDERNNWKAQAAQEGRDPDAVPTEGTVAGRWAETGYLPEGAPGRIVKFDTSHHPGWEVHPHVDEGDYIRTEGEIPMSSAVAVTPPLTLDRRNWSYKVHR